MQNRASVKRCDATGRELSELHRAAVSADPGAGGIKWGDTPDTG